MSEEMEFTEQVDQTETSEQDSPSQEAADPFKYEQGKSLSEKIRENPDAFERNSLTDLEKLEKFKYQGKELTPKQLKDMILMRSDYTRKTQELANQRKEFEQSQKYFENLPYDLKAVADNPELAESFKKIYPKQFHSYLDRFLPENQGPVAQEGAEKVANPKLQAEEQARLQDPRLEELYQHYERQQQEAAQVKIDALFDKLGSKYTEADEARVITKVQVMLDRHKRDPQNNPRPTDEVIEKLFKRDHEETVARFKAWQSKQLKQQREAGSRAAGMGAGGGIPGQAPNLPRTIKEATKAALQDPYFS